MTRHIDPAHERRPGTGICAACGLNLHTCAIVFLMTTTSNLVLSREAAARIGVSIMTLTRMVARGTITPAYKMPGRTGGFLFHETDIARLEAKRSDGAA